MLLNERVTAQQRADEAMREFRQAHETSLKFYERELVDLRAKVEDRWECDKQLIRIIATLQKSNRSAVERELRDTVARLRRELQELAAALTREKADHNLTANRLARSSRPASTR